LENVSDFLSAVAVQGPSVAGFLDGCFSERATGGTIVARPSDLKKNQIAAFKMDGTVVWTARTGYTGEDGFELITPNGLIEPLWNKLLALGTPHGLKPAGLGARDTLRTEVCYPLYGQELDENTTPIEAGVGCFVALDKGDFVGRTVLAEQKARGAQKKCVAFKMTDKSAPPRPHYPIWSAGADARQLGVVTSGTQSPSLGIGIGMGYVPPDFAKPQALIEIEIRGKRYSALVVSKPIYRKEIRASAA
jgi:aminomethyltransferase